MSMTTKEIFEENYSHLFLGGEDSFYEYIEENESLKWYSESELQEALKRQAEEIFNKLEGLMYKTGGHFSMHPIQFYELKQKCLGEK